MNFSKIIFPLALLLSISFFSACNDDDVIDPPEELITTLNYTLTPDGGGTAVTLSFQDTDGDGGNAPIITGGTLVANTNYTGSVEVLNESEDPAEDITEEVAEEDEEHQFFYSSDISGLSFSYDDTDADGNPVGIKTMLSTGDAGSGNISVVLRHEPNKSGSGVSDGDITNAGGETDIEVTIPVTIQ